MHPSKIPILREEANRIFNVTALSMASIRQPLIVKVLGHIVPLIQNNWIPEKDTRDCRRVLSLFLR